MKNRYNAIQRGPTVSLTSTADESLVNDTRAGLTPAEMVEKKLVSMLKTTPLSINRLQSRNVNRRQ